MKNNKLLIVIIAVTCTFLTAFGLVAFALNGKAIIRTFTETFAKIGNNSQNNSNNQHSSNNSQNSNNDSDEESGVYNSSNITYFTIGNNHNFEYTDGYEVPKVDDYVENYDHSEPIMSTYFQIDVKIPSKIEWDIPIDTIPEYEFETSENNNKIYWISIDTLDVYSGTVSPVGWSVRSEFYDTDTVIIRSFKGDDAILMVDYERGKLQGYNYWIMSNTNDISVDAFYDVNGQLTMFSYYEYTYYEWGKCAHQYYFNTEGKVYYSECYHTDRHGVTLEDAPFEH